ncbi:MAG: hypothetical protein J0G97_06900, partial [Rhizobium pusense]|nr:hypothetical protein [Agrobacterium pusense]
KPVPRKNAKLFDSVFQGQKARVVQAVFDRRHEWLSVKELAEFTEVSPATASATLTEMDRLIILDKGRIVEAGSHAELVAMGGIYADLWRRQSGGFIADHEAEAAAE